LLLIDRDGWVIDDKIKVVRRPNLRHGKMSAIHGIIVHQTGAATGQSTLDSYLHRGAAGAHFLIDKDGTIYQTGSVFWRQWHVGKLRARCLAEHRCTPVEIKMLSTAGVSKINKYEAKKSVPQRYPSNKDAIGIELVSAVVGNARTHSLKRQRMRRTRLSVGSSSSCGRSSAYRSRKSFGIHRCPTRIRTKRRPLDGEARLASQCFSCYRPAARR
jgi:N-acetylmuramoyl-L-alanine amidase